MYRATSRVDISMTLVDIAIIPLLKVMISETPRRNHINLVANVGLKEGCSLISLLWMCRTLHKASTASFPLS